MVARIGECLETLLDPCGSLQSLVGNAPSLSGRNPQGNVGPDSLAFYAHFLPLVLLQAAFSAENCVIVAFR